VLVVATPLGGSLLVNCLCKWAASSLVLLINFVLINQRKAKKIRILNSCLTLKLLALSELGRLQGAVERGDDKKL
jgi:hypothetical protein